jgi:hypothetical protein
MQIKRSGSPPGNLVNVILTKDCRCLGFFAGSSREFDHVIKQFALHPSLRFVMTYWLLSIWTIAIIGISLNANAMSASKDVELSSCAGSDCKPSVTVDNFAPGAGDTLTVIYNPGSYASTADDYISWQNAGGRYVWFLGTPIGGGAKGPGRTKWTVPNYPHEYPVTYVLDYYVTVPGRQGTCNNNSPPQCIVAESPVITVPPTITRPPITAKPPAKVTSNPTGWPAKPASTLTVCRSGCNYSKLEEAVTAAYHANIDYTLITIHAGDYRPCFSWGSFNQPAHLWLKGVGGGFAHLIGSNTSTGCFSSIAGSAAQIVLDNVELSDFSNGNGGAVSDGNCASFILRNDYIHDGGMGLITGQPSCHYDVTIINSHFARAGGGDGPSHEIYIGEPTTKDNHLTVTNSIFEEAFVGQLIKSRAFFNTITCNKLLESYDPVNNGSLALDFGGGGGQSTVANNLIAQGPWFTGTNNNETMIEFGVDKSGWYGDQPAQFLVMNGNIVINDLTGVRDPVVNPTGQVGNFIKLGAPMTPSSALPYRWSDNTFIGPLGFFPRWDTPGTSVVLGLNNTTEPGCPGCFNGVASNVKLDDSNHYYATRAAAGLPAITVNAGPSGWYYAPYDNATFPLPSACSEPIGNVTVP